VRCDGDELDRYGRRLAECFVEIDGESISINAALLWAGYAEAYP
jgi:endonuclease YncB( thermonuclease family)